MSLPPGVQLRPREDASPLLDKEIVWRGRYAMLESHGYRLRQRYKPDWTPSWINTKRPTPLHEDYWPNTSSVTIDAVRVRDGRRVFLKRVRCTSTELAITRFFSDTQRCQEPDNHSYILLDEFVDDTDSHFTYMVLRFLCPYYKPEFFSVDEVVDFMKQLLEVSAEYMYSELLSYGNKGLVYMHNLNVAHRDCSHLNIMMDADALYPNGFHPQRRTLDPSGTKGSHPKRRRDVPHVRYYFIDYGISTMFRPDDPKQVLGIHGQDNEVPELSDRKHYNPFFVDVFILGNLFKTTFVQEYMNLKFLEPLVVSMTQKEPGKRPSAASALEMFNGILGQQTWYNLRWHLKRETSSPATRFFQDVGSISRESVYYAKMFLVTTTRDVADFILRRKNSTKAGIVP